MSDRSVVLALLEERPYTIAELASTLAMNQWTLRDWIAAMATDGAVTIQRRPPRPFLVALGTPGAKPIAPPPKPKPIPQATAGPEPILFGSLKARPTGLQPDWPRARRRSAGAAPEPPADVGAVDESSIPPAVCCSCGKRFTPLGVRDGFCSARCEGNGPPPEIVTRVIDGVEFRCLSIGSGPVTGNWSRKRDNGESTIDQGGRHGTKGAE